MICSPIVSTDDIQYIVPIQLFPTYKLHAPIRSLCAKFHQDRRQLDLASGSYK